MDERWEATDECERRFRLTTLRYSSGNIGLAWLADDLDLIRIGPALRPEVAAWRYGRLLQRPRPLTRRLADHGLRVASRLASTVIPAVTRGALAARIPRDGRAIASRLRAALRGNRVLDLVQLTGASPHSGDIPLAVVRYRHLLGSALTRPEPGRPWALHLPHDHGVLAVEGDAGVRLAARLLSVVNGSERGAGVDRALLEQAVRKVDDSARPDSYFNRVLTIALRTNWGRLGAHDETTATVAVDVTAGSDVAFPGSPTERLAFALTGRTFWGNGGIGSEPRTALLDVPLVDRLALEMAAHEESERRALDGELSELAAMWREAAEIAAIADALLPI